MIVIFSIKKIKNASNSYKSEKIVKIVKQKNTQHEGYNCVSNKTIVFSNKNL